MRVIIFLGTAGAYLIWKLAVNPGLLEATPSVGYHLDTDSAAGEIDGIALLIGELVVFFFYWVKFREWAGEGEAPGGFTPRPVNHFTTWLRFLAWSCAYGVIMVGIFNMIVFFPDLISRIFHSYLQASSEMQMSFTGIGEAETLNQAILGNELEQRFIGPEGTNELIPYAVILVTVVWSGLQPFASFERRFRLDLQQRAAIPNQASSLVKALRSPYLHFMNDDNRQSQVVKKSNGLLDNEDFRKSDDDTDLWSLYAQLEYLFQQLEDYRHKPVFEPLISQHASDYQLMEKRMGELRQQLQQRITEIENELTDNQKHPPNLMTLRSADQLLAELNEEQVSRLRTSHFSVQRDNLSMQINDTWTELLQLVVCSVLAVGHTSRHRQQLFEDFGLKLPPTAAQLDADTILNISGIVLGAVFVTSLTYFIIEPRLDGALPPHVPKDVTAVLFWSFSAMIMHLLGAIAGYTTQRTLEQQRERMFLGEPRPASKSERSAEILLAGLSGTVLNVYFLAGMLALNGAFEQLAVNWWWALTPGATAAFTAVYAQIESQRRLTGNTDIYFHTKVRSRLLVFQAAATATVALVVAILLNYETSDQIMNIEGKMFLYVAYIVITGAAIGIGCGLLLSHWASVRADEWIAHHNQARGLEQAERRVNRRPYRARATWETDDQTHQVKVFSISENGAAVYSSQALEKDSVGKLRIGNKITRNAVVLRDDDQNHGYFYLKYQSNEAA